MLMIDLLL